MLQQPHFVQWLTQLATSNGTAGFTASSSGSNGSSGAKVTPKTRKLAQFKADDSAPGAKRSRKSRETPDPKQVKTTSGTPGPLTSPPVVLQLPFNAAAQCIATHFQMKSKLQLHDDALDQALQALGIPTVLIKLIRDYVQELSLQPFELDLRHRPADTRLNQAIFDAIDAIFIESEPNARLMQHEIMEVHTRRALDHHFTCGIRAVTRIAALKAIVCKDAGAIKRRQDEFRAITHYLPYAECERHLKEEMVGPQSHLLEFHKSDALDELYPVNVRLFCEALQQLQPTPLADHHRLRSLGLMEAGYALTRARSHFDAGKTSRAQELCLAALQLYCNLREKRDVIETVVQLIQLSNTGGHSTVAEMMTLFSIAKKLCLTYPVDADLYAKLLFTMDDRLQDRDELELARQLYEQTQADQVALPHHAKAKFEYRQIRSQYRAKPDHRLAMHQINAALDYCFDALQVMRTTRKDDFPLDLDRYELIHSMAQLYRLAADITRGQVAHIAQLSQSQRAHWLSLIKHDRGAEHSFFYTTISQYPALNHTVYDINPTPCSRLLSACTAYYKNALKSMLCHYSVELNAAGRQLFVLIFDELVDFYRKFQDIDALDLLLNKKTIARFLKWEEFKTQVPAWRKSLRDLKKGAS